MLGLLRQTVVLCDHQKAWEESAVKTIQKLQKIFGGAAVAIQHVGSTAISSIKAKPIIDIAVAVKDFGAVFPLLPALEAQGFVLRRNPADPNPQEMLLVCGDFEKDTRTHHIHIVLENSRQWIDYINFRDYLNANSYAARQYEALKMKLAAQYPQDRKAYTNGKAHLIAALLRRAFSWRYLNKTVTVQIDRPAGSAHPVYKDMIYPIPYGYVQDVTGGDGQPQDAYVLGMQDHASSFTGVVTAIIYRSDDVEDKWVVAPETAVFHQAQIAQAVAFTERYFQTELYCAHERSCGAVVYRIEKHEIQYLLVFQTESKTWSFPKGHMEPNETEEQTAFREVLEETGCAFVKTGDFRESIRYPIGGGREKTVIFFVGQISGDLQPRPTEIDASRFCSKEKALSLLPPDRGYQKLLDRAQAVILQIENMQE